MSSNISNCQSCGDEISYNGKYWGHVNTSPRHLAIPDDEPKRSVWIVFRTWTEHHFMGLTRKVEGVFEHEANAKEYIREEAFRHWDPKFGVQLQEWFLDD